VLGAKGTVVVESAVHIPFAKFCAVTAALACAGGGVFRRPLGDGGRHDPAGSLDHYLCAGDFGHAGCDPVTVALPDATTFGVNDPGHRIVCDRMRRSFDAPATVEAQNEFSRAALPARSTYPSWSAANARHAPS